MVRSKELPLPDVLQLLGIHSRSGAAAKAPFYHRILLWDAEEPQGLPKLRAAAGGEGMAATRPRARQECVGSSQ